MKGILMFFVHFFGSNNNKNCKFIFCYKFQNKLNKSNGDNKREYFTLQLLILNACLESEYSDKVSM